MILTSSFYMVLNKLTEFSHERARFLCIRPYTMEEGEGGIFVFRNVAPLSARIRKLRCARNCVDCHVIFSDGTFFAIFYS